MMKKQTKNTLILLAIVVATYLFVWIYPDRDGGIEVKKLAPLSEEKAVRVLLKKSKVAEILLNKSEGKWYVSEKKYLADATKIKKVLDIFAGNLELETISFSGDSGGFSRYGLDESHRSEVYLMDAAGKKWRKMYVGKSANRYLSRYVALGEEKNIYAAQIGDVLKDFSVEAFREKRIVSFVPDNVDWIGVEQQNPKKSSTTLLKLFLKEGLKKGKPEKNKKKSRNNSQSQKSQKNPEEYLESQHYVDAKGARYDHKKVHALINKIATLRALDFFEVAEHPELIKTRLKTYHYQVGDKKETVILYKKAEKGYPLMISSSQQGYLIPFGDGDMLSQGLAVHRLK